jgi:hypothetical protein
MVYKYKYRDGRHIKSVSAQVVGETLADLAERSGGRITPAAVVERAEPEDSPIHDAGFTWDDGEAAQKCREDEARLLMRSYVVIYEDEHGEEQEEIPFVSVARPYDEDGPAYMPTRPAMQDPDLHWRIMTLARAQLEGWVARYRHLNDMGGLIGGVQRALDDFPPPPAPPAGNRPGAPQPPPPGDRPRPRRRRRADDRPQPGL